MDRGTYDADDRPRDILDRTLAESARLIDRWHGADDGRLRYAVTPRFAVSCTAELLRESAALAAWTGAYWQTHVSEDLGEIAEVQGCSRMRSTTSTADGRPRGVGVIDTLRLTAEDALGLLERREVCRPSSTAGMPPQPESATPSFTRTSGSSSSARAPACRLPSRT